MRFKALMLVPVAAALLGAPAVAQTPAPAAAPATAQADPMDEVVCKREGETGSLVKKKKKVCATRRQWEVVASKSREALDQGQMSGSSSGQ
ncbi:hypothetical protein ACFOMD_12630 [Sphingoaurantiacus capsulatus]|uniref:Uncharacterized protein n=1 Tax=Sphingoaurantiacus capsulatus TaxID=1771310 RepID=A0ABV7XDR7_9SPHN